MNQFSATDDRQVFIAWIPFQRRQVSMSSFFGFETVFMPIARAPRFLRPLQYTVHAIRTIILLHRLHPVVIWVQIPQIPLLTAALLYRSLFAPNVTIVADCHNPVFEPPWSRWPFAAARLEKSNLVLVHNHEVVSKALSLGIKENIVFSLEDCPAEINLPDMPRDSSSTPSFLFLTWFLPDEPIEELYEAARLAPQLRFKIAGDPDWARGRHKLQPHPPNVELLGYLSGRDLDVAILSADALLGLTKHPDEQLSTAAEAVGAGKAMVLSDSKLLREMYFKGAVYVDALNPKSIIDGCYSVIENKCRLEAESKSLHAQRIAKWREDATFIKDMIKQVRH